MKRFEGKVVVITGGGGGVGREYATRFAVEGASIVIADLNGEAAEQTARELEKDGTSAIGVEMDVADEAAASRMANRAVSELGGIDILINNAGVHLDGGTPPFTLEDLPQWKYILDVNVNGALNCAAVCREPMRARGGGVILNMSSSGAWKCEEAYDLSKLALNGVTAVLSTRLAPDRIRVVGVAPGLIATPMAMETFSEERIRSIVEGQHVKELMGMDDLASVVLFLCSSQGRFIAGTTVVVDAGRRKKAW